MGTQIAGKSMLEEKRFENGYDRHWRLSWRPREGWREEGMRGEKLRFHSSDNARGTDGLSADNVLSSLVI